MLSCNALLRYPTLKKPSAESSLAAVSERRADKQCSLPTSPDRFVFEKALFQTSELCWLKVRPLWSKQGRWWRHQTLIHHKNKHMETRLTNNCGDRTAISIRSWNEVQNCVDWYCLWPAALACTASDWQWKVLFGKNDCSTLAWEKSLVKF